MQTHFRKRPAAEYARGMTLLEVVVWVAMFTIIFYAIVNSIIYFYRTNSYTIQQAGAVSSAQRGLDLMVRIIREASYGADGAYPIISLAPNQFAFYADVDTDPQIEKIRFFIQGTSLVEGVTNPQIDPPTYVGGEVFSTTSDAVQNIAIATSTFKYYDANGIQVTDVSRIGDVRYVTVSLAVDTDMNHLPAMLMLSSSATLRNLR